MSKPERKSYLVEREKWRVEQWHQLRTSFYVQKDGIAKLHNFLIYCTEYHYNTTYAYIHQEWALKLRRMRCSGPGEWIGAKIGAQLSFPPSWTTPPIIISYLSRTHCIMHKIQMVSKSIIIPYKLVKFL